MITIEYYNYYINISPCLLTFEGDLAREHIRERESAGHRVSKGVLHNLLITHQKYDREQVKIIEEAFKIPQEELDRWMEP